MSLNSPQSESQSDGKLKSLADRINRLLDEKKGIADDITDIYAEAKGNGYVPKVLRKVITRMRMDQNKLQEEEAIQGLYEAALDAPTRKAVAMAAQGATARQIESETGIDQATVARSVSLKKKRETKSDIPAAGVPAAPESCGSAEGRAQPAMRGAEQSAEEGCSAASAVSPQAGVESGPQDIDLTIPAHLDRRIKVSA